MDPSPAPPTNRRADHHAAVMQSPAQVTPNQRAHLLFGVAPSAPVGDAKYRSTYRQAADEPRPGDRRFFGGAFCSPPCGPGPPTRSQWELLGGRRCSRELPAVDRHIRRACQLRGRGLPGTCGRLRDVHPCRRPSASCSALCHRLQSERSEEEQPLRDAAGLLLVAHCEQFLRPVLDTAGSRDACAPYGRAPLARA
jgi:hypothetical protein